MPHTNSSAGRLEACGLSNPSSGKFEAAITKVCANFVTRWPEMA
jgi:hypothetical protein